MNCTTALKRPWLAFVGGLLALGVAACGGSESDEAAPGGDGGEAATKTVSFGVTNPQLPGSAYYVSIPEFLGYWKEDGLKVELDTYNGTGEVMTATATGRTDIGSGGTAGAMAANINGNATLESFYSYIPNSPYWPVVLPDSPIQSLADLEGKTVGTFSLAGDGAALFKGLMKEQGLDPASVNIVEVGIGGTAVQALRKKRIAAYLGYDSVYADIEASGVELRKVESKMDDYGFLGGLFAEADTLEKQRDAIVALGRGVAKGTVFVKANPECALRVHWKVYPESKPAGMSEEKAIETGVESVMARLENQFAVDDQWGRVTEETVKERIDVAVAGGGIPRPLAVDEIWSPELLDEINDFDTQAIEQQARDCNVEGLS